MKRKAITTLFLLTLVMLSCAACGDSAEQDKSEGSLNTEHSGSNQEIVLPETDTDDQEKIVLSGQTIQWDEFPFPTAETFGLAGEDALIYNAAIKAYNPRTYETTFSQSNYEVTDLSLPAFDVYDKSTDTNGNTTYYGIFYKCDYYDLGSGLSDLKAPVYSLHEGKSPAALTVDADGNFVDFTETHESSNNPADDIRRVCGPMEELADYFCGETESYSKDPHKIPGLDAHEMLLQYLDYFFVESK